MATSVRVTLNRRGVQEAAIGGAAVQRLVEKVAGEVADRARSRSGGIRLEGEPGEVGVPITVRPAHGQRARALVQIDHPAGQAVEAQHRLLGGSL